MNKTAIFLSGAAIVVLTVFLLVRGCGGKPEKPAITHNTQTYKPKIEAPTTKPRNPQLDELIKRVQELIADSTKLNADRLRYREHRNECLSELTTWKKLYKALSDSVSTVSAKDCGLIVSQLNASVAELETTLSKLTMAESELAEVNRVLVELKSQLDVQYANPIKDVQPGGVLEASVVTDGFPLRPGAFAYTFHPAQSSKPETAVKRTSIGGLVGMNADKDFYYSVLLSRNTKAFNFYLQPSYFGGSEFWNFNKGQFGISAGVGVNFK